MQMRERFNFNVVKESMLNFNRMVCKCIVKHSKFSASVNKQNRRVKVGTSEKGNSNFQAQSYR